MAQTWDKFAEFRKRELEKQLKAPRELICVVSRNHAAGVFGFLTLVQFFDVPERYGIQFLRNVGICMMK